jgi:hypothetical protein
MIDFNKELVSALSAVLPTYHEMTLTKEAKIPCYSYQERNNYVAEAGDTIGYSRIIYTVKVWSHSLAEIQEYAKKADDVLRPLGFKRTSSGEIYDINSTMIQRVMTYECLAHENFNK